MRKLLGLLGGLLFSTAAFAASVPAPLNAPSASTAHHILAIKSNNSQQTEDTGKVAPTGNFVGDSDNQILINKHISGSQIDSGTIGSARGGAGAVSGALKADGSGNVSQAGCADLTGAGTACQKNTGSSQCDPGSGNLELCYDFQATPFTGTSHTFSASECNKAWLIQPPSAYTFTLPNPTATVSCPTITLQIDAAYAFDATGTVTGGGTINGSSSYVLRSGRRVTFVRSAGTGNYRSFISDNSEVKTTTAPTVGQVPYYPDTTGINQTPGAGCSNLADGMAGGCRSPGNYNDYSGAQTLTSTDFYRVNRGDVSAGAVNWALPTSATDKDWITVRKKDSSANRLTVQLSGTDVAWLNVQNDECTFVWWSTAWVVRGCSEAPLTQVFTATGSNTWTKPPNAKQVRVMLFAAGNAGGSGRRGAAASARAGGNGGQSGGSSLSMFAASDLSATETVTVGVGGTGGTAITADSTNGNDGTIGGTTSFGSHVRAVNGANAKGSGGTTASVAGTATNFSSYGSQAQGGTTSVTGVGGAGSTGGIGGAGGAGGGITAAGDVATSGGAGGAGSWACGSNAAAGSAGIAGSSSPTAGANISSSTDQCGGGGGGGGAASTSAAAQAGAAGGAPGGGGGGGGASVNGNNSGAGGDGGRGEARVTVIF